MVKPEVGFAAHSTGKKKMIADTLKVLSITSAIVAVFAAKVMANDAHGSPQLRATRLLWNNNPAPMNKTGYFNYDPNDKKYGPNAWKNFEKDDVNNFPDYDYFKRFDDELHQQLSKGFAYNYCGWSRYDDDQSPIDLNNEDVNTECYEYHELREKGGSLALSDPSVKVRILRNKLRFEYTGGEGTPSADIPKGWGHQYSVIHADFLMPSAHTIDGRQFAGEYQIWIMSTKGRGVAVITTVVDIGVTQNAYFQTAIDAWEQKYNDDKSACGRKRKLADDTETGSFQRERQEKALKTNRWNPFDKSLLTSDYWWGYEGTTMEPPCYPITEYRVLDKAMTISQAQLEKLQMILFTHIDEENDCEPTSNHFNGSAARPVQPTKSRDLHRCTCIDYNTDKERKSCELDPAWQKKKCPRTCDKDPKHEWYKLKCPPWYNNNCPSWYEGR